MSVPRQNTVWGKFLLEDKEFDVLSSWHLNETIKNKIHAFMKNRKPLLYFPFSPWSNMQPQWKIENGKLYLTGIWLSPEIDMQEEYMTESQGKERIEIIKKTNGETEDQKIERRKLILSCNNQSTMYKIFGVDKIFAQWVNGSMKLLIKESKQKSVIAKKGKLNEKTRYQVTTNLLIMTFKYGVLVGEEEIQETYFTIKNYLENQ
jgi:hypothetical protein